MHTHVHSRWAPSPYMEIEQVWNNNIIIPYSGKLSRGPTFTVFMDNRLRKLNKHGCTEYNVYDHTLQQKLNPQKLMVKITYLHTRNFLISYIVFWWHPDVHDSYTLLHHLRWHIHVYSYQITCTCITVVSRASTHSWVSAHVLYFKGPL